MNAKGAYEKAKNANKRLPRSEAIILRDVSGLYCFFYARDIIKGRWEEAEAIIATDASCAYSYAKTVVKGRWKEAEPIIATNCSYSFLYAKNIIKGRWEDGEAAIATIPFNAHYYALKIIKGRWEEAEPILISKGSEYACLYAKDVLKFDIKYKDFYIKVILRLWHKLPAELQSDLDIMTAYFKEMVAE